jgi:hypothetical protein
MRVSFILSAYFYSTNQSMLCGIVILLFFKIIWDIFKMIFLRRTPAYTKKYCMFNGDIPYILSGTFREGA